MDYFAYVLRNGVGRSYIGVSSDPVRRLAQHNAGESTWTARHRPWALEWSSRPLSLSAARQLENRLKAQKGGAGLATLLRDFGS